MPTDSEFPAFRDSIQNKEFFVVQRESGATDMNIPIWSLRPPVMPREALESPSFPDPRNLLDTEMNSASLNTKAEIVDENNGIFLITNALTSAE